MARGDSKPVHTKTLRLRPSNSATSMLLRPASVQYIWDTCHLLQQDEGIGLISQNIKQEYNQI